ncbi:hypothetical protein ABEG18_05580 [Alsobacter sp. KACC 23698]|uniref:Uncharacterized protein n=1 Tax=Alsobacter sp. KACC 23698 TaxID=3149229 RepID=A0AAU7JJ82_9HYPH
MVYPRTPNSEDSLAATLWVIDPVSFRRECLCMTLASRAHWRAIRELSAWSPPTHEQDRPSAVLMNVGAGLNRGIQPNGGSRMVAEIAAVAPVLLLCDSPEPAESIIAFALGASGLFPASLGVSLLIASIDMIARGGFFLSPSAARWLTHHTT